MKGIIDDYLVKEGKYYIVYRKTGDKDCPIFRTQDKKLAELLVV